MDIYGNTSENILKELGIEKPKSFMKYVIVYIPADLHRLYSLNFNPIIKKIVHLCNKWINVPLNLKGRIAFYKMLIFPKCIYFSFGEKRLQKYKIYKLKSQKIHGGLGAPDFRIFNLSAIAQCILECILEWFSFSGHEKYTNLSLETKTPSQENILALIHKPFKNLSSEVKHNPPFIHYSTVSSLKTCPLKSEPFN
ncbi:hypothetical protein XELAEV_18027064mg [Xenopus laevis]|uniref:Uncharacterized protein n=1 Tax=Xenopus laevis TaxID=8355 RepID=A0A974CVJ8_XENLA|nr:hypothetical protein XELAEV_18027064mg [Xenopus laevis]